MGPACADAGTCGNNRPGRSSDRNLPAAPGAGVSADLAGYLHRAAAGTQRNRAAVEAISPDATSRLDGDALLPRHLDAAAAPCRRAGLDRASDDRRAGLSLDLDGARRWSTGGGDAAGIELHVLHGLEDDLAVFAHDRRIGIRGAAMANEPCIHADAAAGCKQFTQVQRLVVRRGDLDTDLRRSGIDQLDALAGREHDLPLRAANDAVVLDVLADEINHAARRGPDLATVHHCTSTRRLGEPVTPGHKISVREIETGRDEPGDVDDRARTDGDPVGVDQEHPAVRLQLTEYRRGRSARDAIENRAGRRLLHELRDVLAGDREALPVDDRPGAVRDGELVALRREGRLAAHYRRRCGITVGQFSRKARSNGERQQLALPPCLRSAAVTFHPRSPETVAKPLRSGVNAWPNPFEHQTTCLNRTYATGSRAYRRYFLD